MFEWKFDNSHESYDLGRLFLMLKKIKMFTFLCIHFNEYIFFTYTSYINI